jgi:hypothetical protein
MTNDQFSMTNEGGGPQRAVTCYALNGSRHWDLVIGIWSLGFGH